MKILAFFLNQHPLVYLIGIIGAMLNVLIGAWLLSALSSGEMPVVVIIFITAFLTNFYYILLWKETKKREKIISLNFFRLNRKQN